MDERWNIVNLTMTSAFALMLAVGGANLAQAQGVEVENEDNEAEDGSAAAQAGGDAAAFNFEPENEAEDGAQAAQAGGNISQTKTETENEQEVEDGAQGVQNALNVSQTKVEIEIEQEVDEEGFANAMTGDGNTVTWINQVNEQELTAELEFDDEVQFEDEVETGDLFAGSGNFQNFAGINNQNINSGILSVGQNASQINANGAVTLGP